MHEKLDTIVETCTEWIVLVFIRVLVLLVAAETPEDHKHDLDFWG